MKRRIDSGSFGQWRSAGTKNGLKLGVRLVFRKTYRRQKKVFVLLCRIWAQSQYALGTIRPRSFLFNSQFVLFTAVGDWKSSVLYLSILTVKAATSSSVASIQKYAVGVGYLNINRFDSPSWFSARRAAPLIAITMHHRFASSGECELVVFWCSFLLLVSAISSPHGAF